MNTNGAAGGSSSFGSLLSATGGSGGVYSVALGLPNPDSTTPGIGSGGNILNLPGGYSSVGNNSTNGNASGNGGSGIAGTGGAGGVTNLTNNSQIPGRNALANTGGGGSSGAGVGSLGSGGVGGNGGSGIVIVTEFIG